MNHFRTSCKAPSLLSFFLMFLVGCNAHECRENNYSQEDHTIIRCLNSPQEISLSGDATLIFQYVWEKNGKPNVGYTVDFDKTDSSGKDEAVTDSEGKFEYYFHTDNPYEFTGVTVTVSAMGRVVFAGNEMTETDFRDEATGEITGLWRPSKSKAKPKIKVIDDVPLLGEDGRSKIRFLVTEQREGETYDEPVGGAVVKWETDETKGSVTTEGVTDKDGQAECVYEAKDKDNFEGAEVTAKASVKYSDGTQEAETRVTVQKALPDGVFLTCTTPVQKAERDYTECSFKLEKREKNVVAPLSGAEVTFSADAGTIPNAYVKVTTDAAGMALTYLRVSDVDLAKTFRGATITASVTVDGAAYTCPASIERPDITIRLSCTNSPQPLDVVNGGPAEGYPFNFVAAYIMTDNGNEVELARVNDGNISCKASYGKVKEENAFKNYSCDCPYLPDLGQYSNFTKQFPGDEITATLTELGPGEGPMPDQPLTVKATVGKCSVPYDFGCTNSPQKPDAEKKAKLKFELKRTVEGKTEAVGNEEVKFSATNAVKLTETADTDGNGIVECEIELNEEGLLLGSEITATYMVPQNGRYLPVYAYGKVSPLDLTYKLEALQSPVGIDAGGNATVTFQLSGEEKSTGVVWTDLPGRVVRFDAVNGVTDASGDWRTTNEKGQVSVVFKANDPVKFAGGSLKARFEYSTTQGIRYAYSPEVPVKALDYGLRCTNSPQMADQSGTVSFTFELWASNGVTGEMYNNVPGRILYLQPTNGTCPASVTTNDNGKATFSFQLTDLAVQGSVEATYTYVSSSGSQATEVALGIVEPFEDDDVKDEGLKKANKLKDNTYVVKEKEVTVEDLPEGEGMRDYIIYGAKKDYNGETKVIFLEFCKEHPVHATVGGGTIHIRPDQIGQEIDMLQQDPNGLCWMNLFSLQDVEQGYNQETNPPTSFSAPGSDDIAVAKCKFTQNSDGSLTGLAYFKKKDGTEGYFKMKATRKVG